MLKNAFIKKVSHNVAIFGDTFQKSQSAFKSCPIGKE
jgi:hypothetical protein